MPPGRNLAQQLGGRDNYMKEIAANTRKMANKPNNGGGIPVIP